VREQDDTPAAKRFDACKQRFKALAARLPHATVIDRMRDDETARNAANFIDATHATDPVIRRLEEEFAPVIRMGR
jgi:hypothetical protein